MANIDSAQDIEQGIEDKIRRKFPPATQIGAPQSIMAELDAVQGKIRELNELVGHKTTELKDRIDHIMHRIVGR